MSNNQNLSPDMLALVNFAIQVKMVRNAQRACVDAESVAFNTESEAATRYLESCKSLSGRLEKILDGTIDGILELIDRPTIENMINEVRRKIEGQKNQEAGS